MADNPDYQVGTVSITTGTKVLAGVNTFWTTADLEKGDQFGVDGYPLARIDKVNGDGSITLLDNWRGPTLAAGSPYFIRFQADSRFTAQLTSVRKILSQQNVPALAGLDGSANKIPIFTGPGVMDVTDLTAQGRTFVAASSAAAQLAVLGLPEQLAANRVYYVRKDGNDSNTGLADNAGGAFLTIGAAFDAVYTKVDARYFKNTIQVRAGTYAEAIAVYGGAKRNGGRGGIPFDVYLLGDTTTPANVKIAGNGSCLSASGGARVDIRGFELAPAVSGAWCLQAQDDGTQINFGNVRFGACTNADHMLCQTSALITFDANYAIIGGALNHYHADGGNIKNIGGAITVTLTGTPSFSGQFAGVGYSYLFLYQVTFSGGAIGKRYLVHHNGAIRTITNNYNLLPGDAYGVEDGGGRFDYAPRFSVHKGGAAQVILNNTTEQFITFGTVTFNTGGSWNTSGWYQPRSGFCSMSATVAFTPGLTAGSLMVVSIWKNGALYKTVTGYANSTGPHALTCTIMAEECNGSDTYQVYARADSSGNVTVSGAPSYTYFTGMNH